MSSGSLPPSERILLELFSDALSATGSRSLPVRPSLYEHFSRTRYSAFIQPVVSELWRAQRRTTVAFSEGDSEPPPPLFREKLTKDAFDALSAEDLDDLAREIEENHKEAKEKYMESLSRRYDGFDVQQCIQKIPNIIHSLITMLEAVTRVQFDVWMGGPVVNDGIGLINVTSTAEKRMVPLTMPSDQKILFEQIANAMMSKGQAAFLSACMTSADYDKPQTTIKLNNQSDLASQEKGAPQLSLPTECLEDVRPNTPTRAAENPGLNKIGALPETSSKFKKAQKRAFRGAEHQSPSKKVKTHGSAGASQSTSSARHHAKSTRAHEAPDTTNYISMKVMLDAIPVAGERLRRALMSIIDTDLGPSYVKLLQLLVELESRYEFENKQKGSLPVTTRPIEVWDWIRKSRDKRKVYRQITDIGDYATKWWRWWRDASPEWRVFNANNTPVSIVPPGKVESWDALIIPGVNGMLSFVASLYWWGCALKSFSGEGKKEKMSEWEAAMADCNWVMGRLVQVAGQKKEKGRKSEVKAMAGRDRTEEEISESDLDDEDELDEE